MTKDDIVKLAIEHTVSGLKFDEDGLVRFAKLVAEHEREACAKVCETYDQRESFNDEDMAVADSCAEAIRARGQA
jgi:hypothetical protein